MSSPEVTALETQIYERTIKLNQLRKAETGSEVRNYSFATQAGETSLLEPVGVGGSGRGQVDTSICLLAAAGADG